MRAAVSAGLVSREIELDGCVAERHRSTEEQKVRPRLAHNGKLRIGSRRARGDLLRESCGGFWRVDNYQCRIARLSTGRHGDRDGIVVEG